MKAARIVLSLFLIGSVTQAKVYSPKVLTQHVADLSGNWQSFLQYQDFQGKTGQALAEAVFAYLTDTVTGFYHSVDIRGDYTAWENPAIRGIMETSGYYSERMNYCVVRDPVLAFNNHGYGLCFHNSDCFNGIMNSLGFNVRCGGMSDWHKFAEVYFNGGWHYMDADQRGYVKKADGTIPSWFELSQNISLFDSNPFNISPYFPFQGTDPNAPGLLTFAKIKEAANNSQTISNWYEPYPPSHILCHTMDYALRKGEVIRRYWKSDSGRFYDAIEQWDQNVTRAGSYWAGVATQYSTNFNRAPQGPKSFETGLGGSANTTGFGLISYKPDLTNMSADYADGVYSDSNVTQVADGILLASTGTGNIVFQTYSPYVIIAKAGDVQIRSDDTGGAVIKYTTLGVTQVLISKDNGFTWQTIQTGTSLNATQDLSVQMYGRYGYLIKFIFTGNAAACGLTAFETQTMVTVAPMALPRLKTGNNAISYSTGDAKGYRTIPINMHLDIADSAYTKRMLTSNSAVYNPYVEQTKLTNGNTIFKVLGPTGSKMKWCSIGAYVKGGWNTSYDYTFAVSPNNSTYTTVATYQPVDGRHWITTMNQTSELSGYGNTLYVRYHAGSDAGFNRLYLYAHYEDSVVSDNDQVTITYAYEENGIPKTHTLIADSGTVNNLNIAGTVVNKWVEISNPSSSGGSKIKGKFPGLKKKAELEIFPNPFNPNVTISGSGQSLAAAEVFVEIFNIHGKLIQKMTAANNEFSKGIVWNAANQPSGLYLIRALAGNTILDKKAYLIR